MLSKLIVDSYRVLAEIALWGAIIIGAITGGILGALVDHGYLGTALGAVGAFALTSVFLGFTLLLIDLNGSLKRIRDDAINRVPVAPPGFTVSTGAAIAKAVEVAKEVEAATDSAYAPPPAPVIAESPAPTFKPATNTTSPAATGGNTTSVDHRVVAPAVVGAVVLGAVLLLGVVTYSLTTKKESTDEAPTAEIQPVPSVEPRADSPAVEVQSTPVVDFAQTTALPEQEPQSQAVEGGDLAPQWFGAWSSGDGNFRIDIEADGFTFHIPGDDVTPVVTYSYFWRASGKVRDAEEPYLAYVKPSLTRDEILARYGDSSDALETLTSLRPGKYRVVAAISPKNPNAECQDRYVLDEDTLFQIEGCGSVDALRYARQ